MSKLSKILEGKSKFKKVNIEGRKVMNHLIHIAEERIIRLFKRLEVQVEISVKVKNNLYPSGSNQEFYMGLIKSIKHKKMEHHSFAQFYQQPLTSNDYTIKDSFSLAKEILEFDASFFMASFDIKLLSDKTSLAKALNSCIQIFYRNQIHDGNLPKCSFYNPLKIKLFESFFIFDGKFLKNLMA